MLGINYYQVFDHLDHYDLFLLFLVIINYWKLPIAVPHLVEFPCGSITICTASSLKHSCPRGMTTRFDPLPCRLTPKEHMRTLEDETDHVHVL